MGHSLGAYIAVCYCEKYPNRVRQLHLASPAGVPEQDPYEVGRMEARMDQLPFPVRWIRRGLHSAWQSRSKTAPQALARLIGPFGPLVANGYTNRRFQDNGQWRGDTPSASSRAPPPGTCERGDERIKNWGGNGNQMG